MFGKIAAAGAAFAVLSAATLAAPGVAGTGQTAAAQDRVDINEVLRGYGYDTGKDTARACGIVREYPGGLCVFDCGGNWCIAECDQTPPSYCY